MSTNQKKDRRQEAKNGGTRREKGVSNRVLAMSHPLRARVLHLLVVLGPMSPKQLTEEIGGHEQTRTERQHVLWAVNAQCRRLCELGCAELTGTRPVRGAVEHFYRALERPIINTEEWEQLDSITAEDLICGYIQEIIDDFIISRKAEVVGFDPQFHITRTPLVLDEQGMREGMELHERCRLEMLEVERLSKERRAKTGAAAVPVSSSLVYFKVPAHRFEPERGSSS